MGAQGTSFGSNTDPTRYIFEIFNIKVQTIRQNPHCTEQCGTRGDYTY